MEKYFIPYEIALRLKELGFDEPCFGCYYIDCLVQDYTENQDYSALLNCLAPTFSQAFRWFREKCDLTYSIDWMTRNEEHYSGYIVHFRGIEGNKINEDNFIVLNNELPYKGYEVYKTYEEAELACLVKLIEIVKEKK
jgi:hypothetical protein